MTVPNPNPSHFGSDLRPDALPLLTNGDQASVLEPTTSVSNLRDNLFSRSMQDTLSQLGVSYTQPVRSDDSSSDDEAIVEPSNLSYDAMSSSFSLSDALQGVHRIDPSHEIPIHPNTQRGEEHHQSSLNQPQDLNTKQSFGSGTSTPVSLAPLVSLRSSNDDIDFALLSRLTSNEPQSRDQQSIASSSNFDDSNSLDFN